MRGERAPHRPRDARPGTADRSSTGRPRAGHRARGVHYDGPIELLNALRTTQAEHSRTLVDHSRTLAEHTGRFDSIDENLGRLTHGMHAIESLLRRLLDER